MTEQRADYNAGDERPGLEPWEFVERRWRSRESADLFTNKDDYDSVHSDILALLDKIEELRGEVERLRAENVWLERKLGGAGGRFK